MAILTTGICISVLQASFFSKISSFTENTPQIRDFFTLLNKNNIYNLISSLKNTRVRVSLTKYNFLRPKQVGSHPGYSFGYAKIGRSTFKYILFVACNQLIKG